MSLSDVHFNQLSLLRYPFTCFWLSEGLLFPVTDYFLRCVSSKQAFDGFCQVTSFRYVVKAEKGNSEAIICSTLLSSDKHKASDLLFFQHKFSDAWGDLQPRKQLQQVTFCTFLHCLHQTKQQGLEKLSLGVLNKMLMLLALSICLHQSFIPKAHTKPFHGVSVSQGTSCQ